MWCLFFTEVATTIFSSERFVPVSLVQDEAMLHFTTALDMGPKDANMIKSAIDKLDSFEANDDEEL